MADADARRLASRRPLELFTSRLDYSLSLNQPGLDDTSALL